MPQTAKAIQADGSTANHGPEILLAENSGFCFGVQKAVDEVYRQIAAGKTIYTFGPIIHNESVVSELSDKGVRIIADEEALGTIREGCVIIRSHGVAKRIYERIAAQGLELVDATCPFVKRIHRAVEDAGKQGRTVIVIGGAAHAEVEGIVGWTTGPFYVIGSPEEAERFTIAPDTKLTIVSQTTYNYNKFKETVEILEKKGYNTHIMNTICSATEERQAEATRIASEVDVMIVIGGAHSSNSQKLYEICSRRCANTYFIQTKGDVTPAMIRNAKRIGITAGASTPKKIIEEVQTYVRTGSNV